MNDIIEQQFYIYKDVNGNVNVNALMRDETLWLTAKQISELYDSDYSNITKHIKTSIKTKNWQKTRQLQNLQLS